MQAGQELGDMGLLGDGLEDGCGVEEGDGGGEVEARCGAIAGLLEA